MAGITDFLETSQDAAKNGDTQTQTDHQKEPDYTDEELGELENERIKRYHLKDRKFPAKMGDAAFYGIAGEIVAIIQPTSEASREAILAQLLISFGNMLGRWPHRKQAGIHHLNEFAVLIGETAIGRKGTAWAAAQNLIGEIDSDWLSSRVRDGFQSGEAIIHAVRDPISVTTPAGKTKNGAPSQKVTDAGVIDKRLQITEEEFARFLTVAGRPGNTISATIRKAWDGKFCLYTEGKLSPERATGAHISLIGHITLMELLETLRDVENKNGFSNRVLWIAVKREKKIALPGWIEWKNHCAITDRLKAIVQTYGVAPGHPMSWSAEGQRDWRKFYESIIASNKGILGSIIARSDAHVLRLTMIYAILDNLTVMGPKHLAAAIAFWDYCKRSAQWAFGEKTGNRQADKIYWALQHEPRGMTRDQIREDVFNKHIPKTTLDLAFSDLIDAELAFMALERTANAKRPTERWFAKNAD